MKSFNEVKLVITDTSTSANKYTSIRDSQLSSVIYLSHRIRRRASLP